MSEAINNLPPEMQARLAQIMAQAQGNAPAAPAPAPTQEAVAAPPVKPPSLMDHVIALRQEVAAMRNEMLAVAQVTDAVGNAVGQMYAMFQQTPDASNQSSTYSQAFQGQVEMNDDY